jgi:hypothetical protein
MEDLDMDAIERFARRAVGDWYTHEPGSREGDRVAPYTARNRPSVREQLNAARRKHPDWPSEWYVRVPRSLVTWNREDVRAWGLEGDNIVRAFPDARQAEAFAQRVWRKVWHKGDDATIEVMRERVFVCDAHKPKDLEAYERWRSRPDEGRPAATVIFRHGVVLPTAGRGVVIDEDAEARRLGWLADWRPEAPGHRPESVFFDPAALDRAGYGEFMEHARDAWRLAGKVATLNPGATNVAQELRDAIRSCVAVLGADIDDAYRHQAPAGRTAAAPVLAEYAEFEAARQTSRFTAATPVQRTPWEFVRRLREVEQNAKKLVAVSGEDPVARDIEADVAAMAAIASGLRTRKVGLYKSGHVPELAAPALMESEGRLVTGGLAEDLRAAAMYDNALAMATKLPSGDFIAWWGRTAGAYDSIQPVSVHKRLYRSLAQVEDAMGGFPVTVHNSPEAIEMWKALGHDPERVRKAFEQAVREPEAALPGKPEAPAASRRWRFRVAPVGPGLSAVFAEDTWGVYAEPVLAAEADGRLVPLTGKREPVLLSGGTFADRVLEARARWPEDDVQAADLPAAVAKRLADLGKPPEPVGARDAFWHVSPAGETTPGLAVAWTYRVSVTNDKTVRQTAVPLVRKDRTLVRFSAPTAAKAVLCGYELLNERGLCAEGTRAIPAEIMSLARKEAIRRDLEAAGLAARRPSDPFDAYWRLDPERRAKALDAVPEEARSVVDAAALGLMPKELARARNQDVHEVILQFKTAERALGNHLSRVAVEKPAEKPEVEGPSVRLTLRP